MSPNGSSHDPSGPDAAPDEPPPCQAAGADLWFAEYPHRLTHAQALCYRCRIRWACLDIALRHPEP